MKSSTRARTTGWILAVLAMASLVSASETETLNEGVASTSALKDGRADQMSAWSVDAGGGQSIGGGFALVAAIGQPDAGVVSQGDTVLTGGLWAGAPDSGAIFSNGFESGDTDSWSLVVGGT